MIFQSVVYFVCSYICFFLFFLIFFVFFVLFCFVLFCFVLFFLLPSCPMAYGIPRLGISSELEL